MPITACQVLQSAASCLPPPAGEPVSCLEGLAALLRSYGGVGPVHALAMEALAVAALGKPEAPPYVGLAHWLRGASRRQLQGALTDAAIAAAFKQVSRALTSWPLEAGSPGEAELDALLYEQGIRGALRETALGRLRAEVLGEGAPCYGALSAWLRQAGPDEVRTVFFRASLRGLGA